MECEAETQAEGQTSLPVFTLTLAMVYGPCNFKGRVFGHCHAEGHGNGHWLLINDRQDIQIKIFKPTLLSLPLSMHASHIFSLFFRSPSSLPCGMISNQFLSLAHKYSPELSWPFPSVGRQLGMRGTKEVCEESGLYPPLLAGHVTRTAAGHLIISRKGKGKKTAF